MKILRLILLSAFGLVLLPVIIILLIIGYALTKDSLLRFQGYHIGDTGQGLARQLVKEGSTVSECEKFRNPTFEMMGPSNGEHIANCIHEYAKLTKDPSACEPLMPSSYGISCVGGAENHQLPCGTSAYKVYWAEGGVSFESTLQKCVATRTFRTEMEKQCCQVAKVKYLKSENDCGQVQGTPTIYDSCLYQLAWKQKDPSHCANIVNENARSACQVQTRALQQDPSICKGCTPPVENIEDLENRKQ